jgi:AcrR family transcriptional regulator
VPLFGEMDNKEKIMATATELFFRFGIKRITMDDIAREMGVSKKTLYLVFRDKDEMVDLLMEEQIRLNTTCMDEICNEAKDPIAEVMDSSAYMSQVFSKINPVFFYDMKRFYPNSWERFQQFKDKNMIRILESNLRRGIELGIYRSDLNVQMMARYRVVQFDMALDPGVFPSDKMNLAEIQVFLLDHFLHGITTLKGHRLINKYKQLHEDE